MAKDFLVIIVLVVAALFSGYFAGLNHGLYLVSQHGVEGVCERVWWMLYYCRSLAGFGF